MKNNRIVVYYQTLVDLTPLITLLKTKKNKPLITEITLASIHFGYDNQTPYIHLNNNLPNDKMFDKVYDNLKTIKEITQDEKMPVRINLLIGGAGTAFNQLFNNYDIYYNLLKETVITMGFIDGFNLDIEEEVNIEDVIKLVNDLKSDFPSKEIIFAPLAYSLITDEPGMGGFSYKDLQNKIGDKIAYYNVQCYGDYSNDMFLQMVKNGYSADKIVMGMLSGQNFNEIINEIEKIISGKDIKLGGVAVWEYFNAPPSAPKYPYVWCEVMTNILYN